MRVRGIWTAATQCRWKLGIAYNFSISSRSASFVLSSSLPLCSTADFIRPTSYLRFKWRLGIFPIHLSAFVIGSVLLRRTYFLLMSKPQELRASSSHAMERAEFYFAAHPGSPSAVRRPVLLPRSGKWMAILGNGARDESTVGSGETVEAALQAFDAQSRAAFQPLLNHKLRRPKSTKEILKAFVS